MTRMFFPWYSKYTIHCAPKVYLIPGQLSFPPHFLVISYWDPFCDAPSGVNGFRSLHSLPGIALPILLDALEAFAHLQVLRNETSISFSAFIPLQNHLFHFAPMTLFALRPKAAAWTVAVGIAATPFMPRRVFNCAVAKLPLSLILGQIAFGIPRPTE